MRQPERRRWAACMLLAGMLAASGWAEQTRGTTEAAPPPVQENREQLEQRVERLADALAATRREMEAEQTRIQSMTEELTRLREALRSDARPPGAAVDKPEAGVTAIPSASAALSSVEEEQQQIDARLEEQHQVKVESSSRLPIHLTGLVLFNAFVNDGVVDQVDLPSGALLRTPGTSHISTGGSLRQTILGLEGTGPRIWGAQTSGRVSLDFFGGVTGSSSSGPAGIVRMRTAEIAAAWSHDSLRAGYETPLISPLSPASLATVAQPSLAWSGNLWTWAPQIAWRRRVDLGELKQLTFDFGLLDTQTLGAAYSQVVRVAGAGEASGQPSYETRLGYRTGSTEQSLSLGVSGYYGRQRYAGPARVDTWAGTLDATIPLAGRLMLSGEFYRGRGLGSLGGGAYHDVVSYADSGLIRGLDAEGGWAQFALRISPVLAWNLAGGQDSGAAGQLRYALQSSTVTSPSYAYAGNRSLLTNVFYKPWSSITLSPEYRRIMTLPVAGNRNAANIFTLSAGYQF